MAPICQSCGLVFPPPSGPPHACPPRNTPPVAASLSAPGSSDSGARLPHVVVLLGRQVTVRPTVITGMVGRKIGGGCVNDEQVDFEGWIAEYEGRTARSMDSYDAARTVLALFDVGGRVRAHVRQPPVVTEFPDGTGAEFEGTPV